MTVLDLTRTAATDAGVRVRSKSGTAVTLSAGVSATVNSGDSIANSAGSMASDERPARLSRGAPLPFASNGASASAAVVAGALSDASTSSIMLGCYWLGADSEFPLDPTDARRSVRTAHGITTESGPALTNGGSMALAMCFGCTLPTGFSAATIYTEVGLSSDTFDVWRNTTSTGAGVVRRCTQQSVPINTMFAIPADVYSIYVA